MYIGHARTKFDWKEAFWGWGGILLLLLFFLLVIGITFIYSASYRYHQNHYAPYAKKQIIWACVALVPFFIVIHLDYNWLVKNAFLFYWLAILLLVATIFFGTYRGGARRWINFGPALLQTSDVMKLAIIPALARVLISRQPRGHFSDLCIPFITIALPMGLIVIQPDLGTSLVFLPIVFTMSFAAGIKIKHLLVVIIFMITIATLAFSFVLHDYQRKRVEIFINQDQLSKKQQLDAGFHLCQSKIAHGNGGILGRGWRNGSQNKYGLLPERHTDFIFAVIGEEMGLVGTSLVLLLYFILLCCMLIIAYTSLLPAGQLIIVGVVALLSSQIIVNTCMTVGLAPITGLPLPFLSYGGSSLVFNFVSIAMVVSVAGRKIAV